MIWTPRVTVAVVIYHKDRYLLVEEREQGQLVLNQPAGHLENGESIIEASIRETAEETGGEFKPLSIVGVYRWQHPKQDLTFLRFCIAGTLAEPNEPLIPQDPDIIQTHWLSYDEIIRRKTTLRSPLVLKCIDDFQVGQQFPLTLYQDID